MMGAVAAAWYVLAVLALGTVLARWAGAPLAGGAWVRWAERAVLGTAALGWLLVTLAVAVPQVLPQAWVVLGVGGLALTWWRARRAGGGHATAVSLTGTLPSPAPARSPRWALWALGLAALVVAVLAKVEVLGLPIYGWDGWAIWATKARILATVGTGPGGFFSDPIVSYTHQAYPLGMPALMAAIYDLSGDLATPLAKAPGWVLYLAVAGWLYGALRQHLPAWAAGALVLGYACLPPVLGHLGSGCVDLHLGVFVLAATLYLQAYLTAATPRAAAGHLAKAALCATAAVLTKNEGLPLVVVLWLATALAGGVWHRRSHWLPLVLAAALLLLLSLPQLLWQHAQPHTDENYLAQLQGGAVSQALARLPAVLHAVAAGVLRYPAWQLVGGLLLLAALLGGRAPWRQHAVRQSWLILAGAAAVYLLAYLVSPWEPAELVSTTVDRLPLHVAPLALLLAGAHLAPLLGRAPSAAPPAP